MGQNNVVQTGGSDAIRIPKWAAGCALGLTIACLVAGGALGVMWLLTPAETTDMAADVSEEVPEDESDISDRIAEVIREGTGNSSPKLSSAVALEDFQFPAPGPGDDSVVSFVFLDPDGNEFIWKMTLTHPDKTFEDGTYKMNITGQSLTGYSDDSCQANSGQLTCSFVGRSPRFSETTVKVAVTKDNKVVTSFWGRVSEQKTSSGNGEQTKKEDKDKNKDKSNSGESDDHDQASSSGSEEFCTTTADGVEPYAGTVSQPIVSDDWEAGKPLKVEFDLSEEAGSDFPTDTSGYVLLVGEYETDQCWGRDANNPNRLTCEIDLPEGYGHSVQDIFLAFAYLIDEEDVGVIGMCEDTIAIPEMVGSVEAVESDDEHHSSGVDCTAFEYALLWGSLEIAWPEWKAGEPLPITFKFPGTVPGLEGGSSYEGDYKYFVKVSDPRNSDVAFYDQECEYLGYAGKIHCYVPVESGWAGTIKAVELSVANCGPIYQNFQESLPFIKGGGGGKTEDHHDEDHHHDD
jgi:hypothetical protein